MLILDNEKLQISVLFHPISDAKEESMRFLAEANSQCEWLWRFFFIFMMGGCALNTILLVLVSALFCWFSSESTVNAKCLSHPFQFVLPWNQNTLSGYFSEIFFDILTGEAFLTSGSFILFFISLCLHHQAFYFVFQHLVRKLGKMSEKRNDEDTLRKMIRFHISVKR